MQLVGTTSRGEGSKHGEKRPIPTFSAPDSIGDGSNECWRRSKSAEEKSKRDREKYKPPEERSNSFGLKFICGENKSNLPRENFTSFFARSEFLEEKSKFFGSGSISRSARSKLVEKRSNPAGETFMS